MRWIIMLVLGFGVYTSPPPVPRENFVVDECAPGYVQNPPDYDPPCIVIVQPCYRGGC